MTDWGQLDEAVRTRGGFAPPDRGDLRRAGANPGAIGERRIETADQAAFVAERLTSIAGPWKVGDIAHGVHESLRGGSTKDQTGKGTTDRAVKTSRIARRVDLSGPNGSERLYFDEASGQLLNAITQGT